MVISATGKRTGTTWTAWTATLKDIESMGYVDILSKPTELMVH